MPYTVKQLDESEKLRLLRLWNNREPMKQWEVAAVLGVPNQRVYEIETSAIRKIRAVAERRKVLA